MGEATAIGWTDHTFNPWWGCARVSPGCEHCYAETFAKRTGHPVWGKVIAGGESGPGHRPLDLDHARALRSQCTASGVPFFFKQVGGQHPTSGGDLLDGRTWKQRPPAPTPVAAS